MSNITTDFITATKKIHADVRSVLAALHLIGNDVKTIREQNSPRDDQSEPSEEHRSASVVRPAKNKPNSYEAKQYALDRLRFRMERKAFKIGVWTVVILGMYTGLTGYQSYQSQKAASAAASAAKTAQDTLELTLAVNRPNIFPSNAIAIKKADGGMAYRVFMSNASDIQATSFLANCDGFINDKPMGARDVSIPSKPVTISPRVTGQLICGGDIPQKMFAPIATGETIFDIYVRFAYDGPARQYNYCEKERYDGRMGTAGAFMDLGSCDASKPFPQ